MPGRKFMPGNKAAKKLTGEQVLEMRELYSTGDWTYGRLAREFGVSLNTVSNIINEITWQDIAGAVSEGRNRSVTGIIPKAVLRSQEKIKRLLGDEDAIRRSFDEAVRLSGEAPSLYNDPPPEGTFVENTQVLDKLQSKVAKELKVNSELDKLENDVEPKGDSK